MDSEHVTTSEFLSLSKPVSSSSRIVDYDCSSSSDEEQEPPSIESSALKETSKSVVALEDVTTAKDVTLDQAGMSKEEDASSQSG